MKIERISDNQIRCTLNKEDLEGKETLLSELAFGSEKAKGLFRDDPAGKEWVLSKESFFGLLPVFI